MKYFRLFQTHAEHEQEKGELEKLEMYLSYCKNTDEVTLFYNKKSKYEVGDYLLSSGEVIKNEKIGLFLVTSLSYLKNLFSFSNMGTWTKFKDLNIKLPITASGEIDFDFMESFIKAIQKESIKGVDSYLTKNIATTKEIIKRQINLKIEIH